MATVKTVAEAKKYFGLPDNAPVVEIVIDQLPASWSQDELSVVNGKRIAHLSKQAC